MKVLPTISIALFLCLCLSISAQTYHIEKLNNDVNTDLYDEIAPVLSSDGQTIYFTREGYPFFNKTILENGQNLASSLTEEEYNVKLAESYGYPKNTTYSTLASSEFNQDIWIAEQGEEAFEKVSHPDYPLNNAHPNSICAIVNNNQFIVLNQFPEEGGLKKGFSTTYKKRNGDWAKPVPLNIEGFESLNPDVSLAASHDGEVLILSLETKEGYGNNDLYISFKIGKNKYSKPRHLGPAINSSARETSPTISRDKKTVFFSSNRSGGSGGMDIYFVKRLDADWRILSAPQRFISPINTPADESQPYFVKSTGELYFISKRAGSSDIYKVKIAPAIPDEVTLAGYIINPETNRIMSADILSAPVRTNIFSNIFESTNGYFKIKIPKGEPYRIVARKDGYFGDVQTVAFKEENVYFQEQHVNMNISPIDNQKNILSNTVYFARSTAEILEDSHECLEELGIQLLANDHVNIIIEGHTDNIGEETALYKLSEERAIAIKAYLVNRTGVPSERIQTMGYGPAFPVNNNTSEGLRQENRRVEVKVFQPEINTHTHLQEEYIPNK